MTTPHEDLCDGKQGYASRTAIIHVLNQMRRAHRLRCAVRIYRCVWCRAYHYTSKQQQTRNMLRHNPSKRLEA